MSTVSIGRTLRGTGIAAAATVCGLGFEYLARNRVASALGPEGYGRVYLAVTGAGLLATAAQLGCGPAVKRLASLSMADGEPRLAGAFARAGLLVAFLASAAVACVLSAAAGPVAAVLFGDPRYARLVSIVAWAVPALAVLDLAQNALLAWRRTARAMSVTPLYEKAFAFLLLFAALALSPSEAGCMTGLVAGLAIAAVLGGALALRSPAGTGRAPAPMRSTVRELLSFSWPLLVAGLCAVLLYRLDASLIGTIAPAREVGWVHAALPLAELTLLGFVSIVTVVTPPLTEFVARGDVDGFRRFYLGMQRWTLWVTGPPIALVLAFPGELLSLLYPAEFAPAAGLLRLFALAFLVACVSGPSNPALVALGKPKEAMLVAVSGLAVLCAVDAVLLPRIGTPALGVGRIAGFLAFFGGGLALLRMRLGPMPIASHAARSVGCVLLSALGGAAVGALFEGAPAVARLAIGGGVVVALFASAALALGAVTVEDRSLIRAAARFAGTPRLKRARSMDDEEGERLPHPNGGGEPCPRPVTTASATLRP